MTAAHASHTTVRLRVAAIFDLRPAVAASYTSVIGKTVLVDDHEAGRVFQDMTQHEHSDGAALPSSPSGAGIAALLVAKGVLTPAALARARTVSAETRERLDLVLTRLGLVSEADLVETYAEAFGLDRATLADAPSAPLLTAELPERFLRHARLLPIAESRDGVVLAMAHPDDEFSLRAVRAKLRRPVFRRVAAPSDVERMLDLLYAPAPSADDRGVAADSQHQAEDAERLRDLASDAPVIRLVNRWLVQAVEAGASDIHIEPGADSVRLRMRLDGVLQEIEQAPRALHAAIVSRIKIMARLDVAERRLPQDGRLGLAVRGRDVDVRVSIMPTVEGESVVLRILNREVVQLDFAALGFDGEPLRTFLSMLERPEGIILVTGPVGSGKTTTLYAAIERLRRPGIKIVTVEDPVEYRIAGITQSQVNPEIGFDFADALRSLLRHDLDVMMVGEIRDLETARIAVRSALIGRRVLSTLHTNDAVSSMTRLMDMGIEDYLLTATVIGVVAQRLVRRLCPACREPFTPSEECGRHLASAADAADEVVLYRAVGCPHCRGTGYRGRLALTEVLMMTEPLRRLIMRKPDADTLRRAAVDGGMTTLYQDGVRKVLGGLTTIEEVLRVARAD